MLTEEQWLVSRDPADMLRLVRRKLLPKCGYKLPIWFAHFKKDRAPRKIRLFLLACCRRILEGNADPVCGQLLDVLERFVETPPPLLREENVLAPFFEAPDAVGAVSQAVRGSVGHAVAALRGHVGRTAALAVERGPARMKAEKDAMDAEAVEQCNLLRDIFNPSRPLTPAGGKRSRKERGESWQLWGGGLVPRLAESIYAEQAFAHMPVLADALEESGCPHADFQAHCRQTGHVRGCWLLDELLGKK